MPRNGMWCAIRASGIALLAFACSLSVVAGELVTYYHNDVAGSPVAATDEKGYFIWHAGYEPYGERIQGSADYTASLDNDRWFTSHVEDVETGTVYMQARHYDPVIGRFLSMDPVGFTVAEPHTFTRYAYAANNPYRYTDPDGREIVVITANGGKVDAFNRAVRYLSQSQTYSMTHARLVESSNVYTVLVDPKAESPPHEFDPVELTRFRGLFKLHKWRVCYGQVKTEGWYSIHAGVSPTDDRVGSSRSEGERVVA